MQCEKVIVIGVEDTLARREGEGVCIYFENIVPIHCLHREGLSEGENGFFHDERGRMLGNEGWQNGERGGDGSELDSYHG